MEGGAPVRIYGTGWPEARGMVVRRTPGDLDPGTYVDTIRIRVEGGSAPVSVVVVDSLLVGEDLPVEAAVSAVFGEHDLDAVQARALDRLGNRDRTYDLGDALSWVARCGRGEGRCGPSSPALPRTDRVRRPRPRRRRRYYVGGFVPDIARRNAHRSTQRVQLPYRSDKRLHRLYQIRFRRTLLVAAAVAWGCGGDEVVEPPVATTAVVAPAEVNLVALQESARFQATIYDQNGQVMRGAPVTWSTSDVSVAVVDATGTAVSAGNGRARIDAASGNATAAASVRVTLPVANDPNGHRVAPARITWTTIDPAVATVDPHGWVRTVGPGQVRISVDVGGFVRAQDYSVELDPGFLKVALTLPPDARNIGALLALEGPAIDSLRAPGLELYQSRASAPRQIIVAGPLSSESVLEFRVPHRRFHARYRVQLLQVVGEDYARKDLTGYAAVISR